MPAGDVANAEVDQLDGRIRRREMSSRFGDLSQLVIHGLNGVRRVDYLSDCWMELKEGNELSQARSQVEINPVYFWPQLCLRSFSACWAAASLTAS
jgi:hypothetical protein